MSLARKDFGEFFERIHDAAPFAWQERLLDAVLATGRWPDHITAPTGSGKTAAIDVHVFAQALTVDSTPRPPRRLSMIVPRRVLVDSQYEHARRIARALAAPDTPVLKGVAERLWRLRTGVLARADGAGSESPLVVGRLRGGYLPSRAWRDEPAAATVLCATPDMWGSRLLFRGYGTSRYARPREAGLLAIDSVVVVDEAHLARQVLCTATRVAQLAAVAEAPFGPPIQVVLTTATPPDSLNAQPGVESVGVLPADLTEDGVLNTRLTRPKPVTLLPVAGWASQRDPQRRAVAADLADAVVGLVSATEPATESATEPRTELAPARTVGCFVNTVRRAVDVAGELRRRTVDGRGVRVVLICGQVRPYDLDQLRREHPGLLDPAGNAEVDVIVSTQSLEVGADLDLAGAVTELASGSALAQRAGRVNRRGLRPRGPVVVAVPAEEMTDKTSSGPYDHEELRAALAWLRECAAVAGGLAPWTLRELRPPTARQRRPHYQEPQLADAWHWARTSDVLAAEPELDLWLSDNLGRDTSVGIVVRERMPGDALDAVQLVKDLPPRRHEVFPVPYRAAMSALARWRATEPPTPALREHGDDDEPPVPVVMRGGEVEVLDWRQSPDPDVVDLPRIRPGDVVVLDAQTRVFTARIADSHGWGFSPQVVITGDDEDGDAGLLRHTARDVLTAQADLWEREPDPRTVGRDEIGRVVLRIESGFLGADDEALKALSDDLTGPDAPSGPGEAARYRREVLRDWLQRPERVRTPMTEAAGRLLDQDPDHCELVIHPPDAVKEPEDQPDDRSRVGRPPPPVTRVLLLDRRRRVSDDELLRTADEDLLQVAPAPEPVHLDRHQAAVANRAATIGGVLGLASELIDALRAAGTHHDDGKLDPRFQTLLGRRRGDEPLAKSLPGMGTEQHSGNAKRSRLPAGWRHEQRSVVEAWERIQAHVADQVPGDALLIARLIGTSHGRGRTDFPHVTGELLTPEDGESLERTARELFDGGHWDVLIERTHQRYGVWGCAYLEAVLRAADCQVSQEGS